MPNFFPYGDSVVMSITGTPRGNADQRRCSKPFRELITEGVKYVRVKF
jgi:hypothetical protein